MIQTDPTFNSSHSARQKQPLYYLEIDEVDVMFSTFVEADLKLIEMGYGVHGYGLVGYGF